MILNRLEIELTRACPLKCLHCSVPSEKSYIPAFPPQKTQAIFEEFLGLGGKEIILTGGEPLGLPLSYFLEIIPAAKEARTLIYSSGFFPDQAVFKKLKSAGLTGMCITLHGDETIHDLISGVDGSYSKALASIKLLNELGLFCRIHFTPNALNYQAMEHILSVSNRFGVNEVKIFKLAPQGRAIENWAKLSMSKEQHNILISTLQRLHKEISNRLICGGILPEIKDTCSLGRKIAITSSGDIIPCLGLRNRTCFTKIFGNIFDSPLKVGWVNLSNAYNEKSCVCFSCDEIVCGPKES